MTLEPYRGFNITFLQDDDEPASYIATGFDMEPIISTSCTDLYRAIDQLVLAKPFLLECPDCTQTKCYTCETLDIEKYAKNATGKCF